MFHFITTMRCCDQGAHIRERLTANRSDLTLQGGPNTHITYRPHRTIRDNPFICTPNSRTALRPGTASPTDTNEGSAMSFYTSSTSEDSIKSAYRCAYSTELTGFDYLLLPACG